MIKDKYKNDIIRSYVEVNRKPFNQDEVISKTSESELPSQIKELLDQLDVVKLTQEEFNEWGGGFFTYFLNGDIQFYIVYIGEKKYFVDTQGYDYARYVGELVH